MYSVIYRKGGFINFSWNRLFIDFESWEEARLKQLEIEKAGYRALVFKSKDLQNIGLPETYSSKESVCLE